MDKVRRLRLEKGDAAAMHEYFMRMTADNSEFFYAMDFSDKGRLVNVFWADARSRAAFKEFGDVITLDTTYLVNKYDMPFAPFVGVNHHGQSILLGCGLISHEDTKSFSWLFWSWLTCMGNSPPKAIITDQDKVMKKAIEIVLPNTRHRWCLWYIMKKLPEKLRGYNDYEQIKWCLQNAVYDSLSKEEFEEAWGMFIEKYQLQSNEWLLGLYEERSRWVPAFVKDAFWAGMSSTQRSESMHHYFDGYINSKTTLKQFVEQYENALAQKVENENNADFHSLNSYIPCIIGSEMEQQFQSEYTNAKFKEFNEEFVGKLTCSISTRNRDDTFSYYNVQEVVTFGEEKKRRRVLFTVCFEEDSNEAKRNCQFFEFKGILCRHQMMVFHDRGIDRVPETYVLKRWSKIVKRGHTKVRIKYDNSVRTIEARRYDNMCNFFSEVAELAQEHRERYDIVMAQIRDWKEEWKEPLVVCASNTVELAPISGGHNDSSSVEDGLVLSKESTTILDPLIVSKKGRPPVNRKQGYREKIRKNRSKGKKKTKSKRTKEVVEDVGHVLGTQESVNVNSHTSYIAGQSYKGWRPPVPYQYYGQPNTVQGGGYVPFYPSSQNSQVLVGQPSLQSGHRWGGGPSLLNVQAWGGGPSLLNAQAWGGGLSLSNAQAWGGPSLSNAQAWVGGPSLSNAQAWGGGQLSLVEMLTAINGDE